MSISKKFITIFFIILITIISFFCWGTYQRNKKAQEFGFISTELNRKTIAEWKKATYPEKFSACANTWSIFILEIKDGRENALSEKVRNEIRHLEGYKHYSEGS